MKLLKMRIFPLLVLILCTAMLFAIPAMAAADSVDLTGFAHADKFTVTTTEYSTRGAVKSCTSSVTLGDTNKVIKVTAKGYVTTETVEECGQTTTKIKDRFDCYTIVTLTAKADVTVTCQMSSEIMGFRSFGGITPNSDGSKTVTLPKGASMEFYVMQDTSDQNEPATVGTFTLTSVTDASDVTVPGDSATYLYNGTYYNYFDQVLAAAKTNGGKIVVTNSGKVYDSSVETDEAYATKTFTYTIPKNVNLLIPYDENHTLITADMNKSGHYTEAGQTPAKRLYCQLTMPSGIKFEVEGGISVGSQACSQMVGQVGPYGAIKMDKGSSITVKSDGNLYAYGYIFYGANGGGTVTVKSGGKVYETAFIMDYPGSASSTAALYFGASGYNTIVVAVSDKSKDGDEVFPMRAYTVRNVEVPMTLESGAEERAFYSLYAGTANTVVPGYFLFIGSDNSAPFALGTGTTLTKSYSDGVQSVIVDGDITMNSMGLNMLVASIARLDVKTSDTTGFPLPSGFDVKLTSGTMTLNDNIFLLEGTKITVDAGAAVNSNGKNFFVMDADIDTGAKKASDVHGKSYTLVEKDAILDINGTVNVTGGGAYTSASSSKPTDSTCHAQIICSEGTGKIVYTDINLTDVTTYVRVGSGTSKINPTMNSAYLLNGDGTYAQTGAGPASNTYVYLNDKWVCVTHTDTNSDSICDACGSAWCAHSTLTEVTEVPAGCETDGTIAHYVCSCGMKFDNNTADKKALSGAELIIPATGHQTLTAYPAAESTCSVQGNSAYWQCESCKMYFSDAAGTTKIEQDSWLLPLKDHAPGAVATCTTAQTCTVCSAELVPALEHAWTVTYDFADDGKSCSATRACGNDAEHNETAEATVNSTRISGKEATFDAMGWTLYTATFPDAVWAESQIKEVQDIPVLIAVAMANGQRYTTLAAAVENVQDTDGKGAKVFLLKETNEVITVNKAVAIYDNNFVFTAGCTLTPGDDLSVVQRNTSNDAEDAWIFYPAVDHICHDKTQLTVEGEIILKLKFFVPFEILNADDASVSWIEDTNTVITSQTATVRTMEELRQHLDDYGRVVLEQGIASGEMASNVEVHFKDAGGSEIPIYVRNNGEYTPVNNTFKQSVYDYASAAFSQQGDKYAEIKKLTQAMLTYGGYAQRRFKINAQSAHDFLETVGSSAMDISGVTTSEKYTGIQALSAEGDSIGITYASQKVLMDSKLTLVTFFTLGEGKTLEGYTFELTYPEGGENKTRELTEDEVFMEGSRVRVEIRNIPVAYWDNAYTITAKYSGNSTYAVTSTVLAWAKRCITANKNLLEVDVAKAMFLYNQAANEYFGR